MSAAGDAVAGSVNVGRPRLALICHDDDLLALDGLTRWLASFADLRGVVVVSEPRTRRWRRVRRELARVGPLRLLDVFAYRVLHRWKYAQTDLDWTTGVLESLRGQYEGGHTARILAVLSASSPETQEFLAGMGLDILLARYKSLLPERIYSIPRCGTFVMHPGICPEYRNAHGCFWALARRDLQKVGVTLLRIDRGIDTGPVFGHFRANFDEIHESHVRIQERSLFENLAGVSQRLLEVHHGVAQPLPTAGHESAEWGQPWLTRYIRWKAAARREGRT